MGGQPATQGHGKVWAHAATKGLSGSLVPPQPGSVLTSVTHVAFKGHKDAHSVWVATCGHAGEGGLCQHRGLTDLNDLHPAQSHGDIQDRTAAKSHAWVQGLS